MKKLYTAFKGSHNTSFQLVNQINGDRLFLTNSFQGLEKNILSLSTDYDAIYVWDRYQFEKQYSDRNLRQLQWRTS